MSKTLQASLVLVLACSGALADRLTLIDGREFTGKVTEEATVVSIETAMGTVSFPWSEVAFIERMPTPEAQLAKRIAEVDAGNVEGIYDIAVWADQQGLKAQAGALYLRVLALDNDHLGARRSLRHVQVGQQWHAFEKALQIIEARIASGQVDAAALTAIEALLPLADGPEQAFEIRRLQARALLRRGQFLAASEAFAELAKAAENPNTSARLAAIAEILVVHPDGLYVLTEAYPPTARVLGRHEPVLPSGPASLSLPGVLAAALRDKARVFIQAGAKLLGKARSIEPTQPEAARRVYLLALREFGRADALVDDIARSYKIQCARRRIAIRRKGTEQNAARFDGELAALGRQAMTPAAYTAKLTRMIRHLRTIRSDLDAILKLAEPYAKELVLEVKWAELDKQRITKMEETLKQELNEPR